MPSVPSVSKCHSQVRALCSSAVLATLLKDKAKRAAGWGAHRRFVPPLRPHSARACGACRRRQVACLLWHISTRVAILGSDAPCRSRLFKWPSPSLPLLHLSPPFSHLAPPFLQRLSLMRTSSVVFLPATGRVHGEYASITVSHRLTTDATVVRTSRSTRLPSTASPDEDLMRSPATLWTVCWAMRTLGCGSSSVLSAFGSWRRSLVRRGLGSARECLCFSTALCALCSFFSSLYGNTLRGLGLRRLRFKMAATLGAGGQEADGRQGRQGTLSKVTVNVLNILPRHSMLAQDTLAGSRCL